MRSPSASVADAVEQLGTAAVAPLGRCHRKERVTAMADTYTGEIYCLKCKGAKQVSGEITVSDKGRRSAKATCPDCGTKLNKFLPKA